MRSKVRKQVHRAIGERAVKWLALSTKRGRHWIVATALTCLPCGRTAMTKDYVSACIACCWWGVNHHLEKLVTQISRLMNGATPRFNMYDVDLLRIGCDEQGGFVIDRRAAFCLLSAKVLRGEWARFMLRWGLAILDPNSAWKRPRFTGPHIPWTADVRLQPNQRFSQEMKPRTSRPVLFSILIKSAILANLSRHTLRTWDHSETHSKRCG
jgi:hypothetical protein